MPNKRVRLPNYAPRSPQSPSCDFKKPCDYKDARRDDTICRWNGRCNQQKNEAD